MATIIDNLLPSSTVDYVAVFDSNFNQVFRQARAIKAIVKEQAKLMEHPVETGAVITDHRVILPVEIELSMVLQAPDYQDVYRAIRSYYFNGTVLMVQTRSGIYENQIISSMPHQEDPDQYNALTLALSLKQVQFVTASTAVVPRDSTNATTVNRGTQQATTAPTASTTLNWITGG
jgi:hypothetical protein